MTLFVCPHVDECEVDCAHTEPHPHSDTCDIGYCDFLCDGKNRGAICVEVPDVLPEELFEI